MRPRIAVITTCWNDARFVGQMMDSVRASTVVDYEHVCVNNGSTDESGTIMADYAASDSRVRVTHLPENISLGGGMNVAVAQVRAPWLLKLDADDLIDPTYLAEILRAAEDDPAVNCIFSPARIIGHGYPEPQTYRYPAFDGARMIDTFLVPGPSAWPLDLWRALGGLDERMTHGEDWDFAVRAERLVGLRCYQLAEPRWSYRQHAEPRMHVEGMRRQAEIQAHMLTHTRENAALDPVALGFRSTAYAEVSV